MENTEKHVIYTVCRKRLDVNVKRNKKKNENTSVEKGVYTFKDTYTHAHTNKHAYTHAQTPKHTHAQTHTRGHTHKPKVNIGHAIEQAAHT